MKDEVLSAVTVWLLALALLALLVALAPAPRPDCLVPPNAPTRGFYEACWTFWELWS